ncbi:MAG: PD40 domain-containing protein [Gammaproteobacteria bacterium]|nr:PD40 domain-containing protein [Gammaproteobacteria bacterium]
MKRAVFVAVIVSLTGCQAVAQPDPQVATWVTAHTDRNPTVSPDGTQLIFQSDRSGRRALYLRAVEGGQVTVFLDSGDEPRYADWSPDGKRVAFAANVDGEDDIFVIDIDGTNRQRLTRHPARDGHPRWSPDGSRIFFNSERVATEPEAPKTGEDVVDIFSIRPDGTDLKRHTWCRSECSYPSVSPDGTKLLYRRVFWTLDTEGARVRNSDVVIAKLDGSDEVNITDDPAYDVYPIWSHDGHWVYFSSVRPAVKRQMHLW